MTWKIPADEEEESAEGDPADAGRRRERVLRCCS